MLHARCHMQSPCRGLKNRFRNVVLISAIQVLHMQIEPSLLDERLQEFLDQFGLKVAYARRFILDLIYKIRPARQIDHHTSERFIQWNVGVAETNDPASIA